MAHADEFQATVDKTIEALRCLINGDGKPFLDLYSHADDVTIFGGFGSYVRGWENTRANGELAASRFKGGELLQLEQLSSGVSGDLAYTVWIERYQVKVEGRQEPGSLAVRVTHIFRREDGVWKLIHRHGDPILQMTEAAAVLQDK
jgi:ketosteroid isomerase-like protein